MLNSYHLNLVWAIYRKALAVEDHSVANVKALLSWKQVKNLLEFVINSSRDPSIYYTALKTLKWIYLRPSGRRLVKKKKNSNQNLNLSLLCKWQTFSVVWGIFHTECHSLKLFGNRKEDVRIQRNLDSEMMTVPAQMMSLFQRTPKLTVR